MDKFYKIHDELRRWDVSKISAELRRAVTLADLNFDLWKGTVELRKLNGEKADITLHHDQTKQNPAKITNGDVNLTSSFTDNRSLGEQLFMDSGRRGNVVNGKPTEIPKIPDYKLSTLNPIFKGTILDELHTFMQDYFKMPIRIRCQNRTVSGTSQGLYWHKDDPVENRFHIPLWTNPGHVLLFTDKNFKWKLGFDPVEASVPMDFVGHYVPADGRVYELFTKDYMHAVASTGVGWVQPREEQTRCHLSFWIAKN